MLKVETTLEELEEKLLSYESFKDVLQKYLQRLLAADQNTLSVVAEMLDSVKALSSARSLAETPPDLHRVLELRKEALYRYGGVAHVEDAAAPPLLEGGIIKLDDPQVYGMSLICTWLDCIISNPEQSLDSLRKVFLKATDPWGVELNRTFHVDIGRIQPIVNPNLWLANLTGAPPPTHLHLGRVTNTAQALELESPRAVSQVPLSVWRHLLRTRPVYDLTARFMSGRADAGRSRLIAMQREPKGQSPPCLYRLSIDPIRPTPPLPPITLGDVQANLGCTLVSAVRLELVEKGEHLTGNATSIFTAHLPLGKLLDSFSLALNHPPQVIIQDITPPATPASQRLLRVSSAEAPDRVVQLFRVQRLPETQWPSQQGWTQTYRFYDLGDIGVTPYAAEAYLEVSLRDSSDIRGGGAKVHFHHWGDKRLSLSISDAGLRRAAQTGTIILLQADEEMALDILASLQSLIGPAAQEIEPVVSRLECKVRWHTQMGGELFKSEA